MDTLKLLQQHWQTKHFNHLVYCLNYCQSYFEDHFEFEIDKKSNSLLIDGETVNQNKIVEILSEYYNDVGNNYQTSFGDTLYLFFTDLVEDNVDILSEIEEEVA